MAQFKRKKKVRVGKLSYLIYQFKNGKWAVHRSDARSLSYEFFPSKEAMIRHYPNLRGKI